MEIILGGCYCDALFPIWLGQHVLAHQDPPDPPEKCKIPEVHIIPPRGCLLTKGQRFIQAWSACMQSFLEISSTQRERLAAAYSRHLEDMVVLHSLEIAHKLQVPAHQLYNVSLNEPRTKNIYSTKVARGCRNC